VTTQPSKAQQRYDDVKFEVVNDPGFTVEQAYAVLAELPLPAVEVEPVEE
jgi:hypothetical protein